jgi:hypothetical protein
LEQGHRREMARQDYLAAARRRAETSAYRREMARQDYLAARRDRAEARGWRRVEARQRYLHGRSTGTRLLLSRGRSQSRRWRASGGAKAIIFPPQASAII